MKKRNLVFFSFLLLLLPSILVSQTPPEDFLGHKVGADRKLADYNQILAFFEKLNQESEKIKVLTIGRSTLNKPIIMAVITLEENMAKLDTYRGINKKLRDARDLTPDEARVLAKEGKVIVFKKNGVKIVLIACKVPRSYYPYSSPCYVPEADVEPDELPPHKEKHTKRLFRKIHFIQEPGVKPVRHAGFVSHKKIRFQNRFIEYYELI